MADRRHAHRPPVVCDLIEDAIGADAQRSHAAEGAAELPAGVRLAFEKSERLLDSVDERPVERQQLTPSTAREDD